MITTFERIFEKGFYQYRSANIEHETPTQIICDKYGMFLFSQRSYSKKSAEVFLDLIINGHNCKIRCGTHYLQYGPRNVLPEETQTVCSILEDNGTEMKVLQCQKARSNIFNGISYYKLPSDDGDYNLYEYGEGRKKYCICVWRNDKIVAIAERYTRRKPFGSAYKVYTSEDSTKIIKLILSIMFVDIMEHRDNDGENPCLRTWQKELKNKYDENFILKIKAMDEIKI